MADHRQEFINPDRVDVQHEVHARATGRNQTGVAENLGRGTTDATLSWAGGRYTASEGWGDTKAMPESAAGLATTTIRATEPKPTTWPMVPEQRGGQLNGVDEVARGRK